MFPLSRFAGSSSKGGQPASIEYSDNVSYEACKVLSKYCAIAY